MTASDALLKSKNSFWDADWSEPLPFDREVWMEGFLPLAIQHADIIQRKHHPHLLRDELASVGYISLEKLLDVWETWCEKHDKEPTARALFWSLLKSRIVFDALSYTRVETTRWKRNMKDAVSVDALQRLHTGYEDRRKLDKATSLTEDEELLLRAEFDRLPLLAQTVIAINALTQIERNDLEVAACRLFAARVVGEDDLELPRADLLTDVRSDPQSLIRAVETRLTKFHKQQQRKEAADE